MDRAINYGIMHAQSEAVLVAKKIYTQHTERYAKYGNALLSRQRINNHSASPLEEYIAECVVRYDFIHGGDEDYPGIDTVSLYFMDAFDAIYTLEVGEE